VRILLTGGSSFTGLWFARSLAAKGHTVVASLRGSDYSGLRGSRVALLRRVAEVVEDCPFGSARFLDLAGTGSWDLLCQHAAQTGDYRNPDFVDEFWPGAGLDRRHMAIWLRPGAKFFLYSDRPTADPLSSSVGINYTVYLD